jgi:DGQHR domain-containing protein
MIATQIRQKDGVYYFVSYPAQDLLNKIRFISRFYEDGGSIAPAPVKDAKADDVAAFIAKVEKSDNAFQRQMSKPKVAAIKNFYQTANTQPPIPATVLLFTKETLRFDPLGNLENVGNLEEPRDKYLIIDGQHRLAALEFYFRDHPDDARTIHVPCVIFDGKSDDFAAEMFVTINSTSTRINKSHLIDLYEKVSWAEPDRKHAARIVDMLYSEGDSPLRYRINRLGGRSKKDKWILQAELFNEIHREIKKNWKKIDAAGLGNKRGARKDYERIRDFLRGCEKVWGETWGNAKYMITEPVTLKAMLRAGFELQQRYGDDDAEGRQARWQRRLAPWAELKAEFRRDGFYERFPAKGQVERVGQIHRRLVRDLGARV